MRRSIRGGLVVAVCLIGFACAQPAFSQPHGPRPAPAHGPVYGPRPGGPHFSMGFYSGPWYGPYFYSPWFYSSVWWYPPYASPYYYGSFGANVKIQVQPKSAEVYVDGYLAGIVDQFDGMFQDLRVEPGTREITIYQEGYKSIVQRLYLSGGNSYKIKGALEKLAPGEPNEARPTAADQPPLGPTQPAPRGRPAPPPAPGAALSGPSSFQGSADSRFGQLAIRVQPGGAEVIIDGEAWKGPQGADRLVVHLPAGTHRVEVRKEGFDPLVTAVEIKRGEVATLNVSLAKL
jgi:hypothetical protein